MRFPSQGNRIRGPGECGEVGNPGRPSFSAHVRWCEHGAPRRSSCGLFFKSRTEILVGDLSVRSSLEGKPAVSHISRKTSEMPRISCTQLWKEPHAPFIKERRMRFREPTKLHRKSRVWGTRRLTG